MTDTEAALENVIGSMAIEGFTLSDEDIARCRAIFEGDVEADDVVADLLQKHRAIAKANNEKRDAS